MTWQTISLSTLGTIFDGPHATPTRQKEGPYFLNISSLENGRLNLGRSDHVSESDFIKWTKRVTPQQGDLLFSYETRLGEAALMPDNVRACLGRRMALLRPDRAVIDPRFLLYLYLSPVFQSIIETRTIHGATVNRIGLATMGAWHVPVPDLREQQAIADVLSALDDKIALNSARLTTIADLADTIYAATNRHSISIVNLAELVTTQYGVTASGTGESGPRLLRVTDINKRPWIECGTAPVCAVSPDEFKRYQVKPGDILIARMADPGKVGYADEGIMDAVFASYLIRLKAYDPEMQLYLYHFLRSPQYQDYAESVMSGSVQRNLNAKTLVSTSVNLPADHALTSFNRRVSALRNQIQTTLAENDRLKSLRDTLLPHLMSGRLRVKEAEKLVEAMV